MPPGGGEARRLLDIEGTFGIAGGTEGTYEMVVGKTGGVAKEV